MQDTKAVGTPRPDLQAVVVIHGMGEQIPMDTIKDFVRSVWQDDKEITRNGHPHPTEVWRKPDPRTGALELRRITTRETIPSPPEFPAGVRTDFYELYWADLTAGATWDSLEAWVSDLRRLWPAIQAARHRRAQPGNHPGARPSGLFLGRVRGGEDNQGRNRRIRRPMQGRTRGRAARAARKDAVGAAGEEHLSRSPARAAPAALGAAGAQARPARSARSARSALAHQRSCHLRKSADARRIPDRQERTRSWSAKGGARTARVPALPRAPRSQRAQASRKHA